MEDLKFSTNWNNKLDCKAFTTLRLPNQKYAIGKEFNITLNGVSKGTGVIHSIKLIAYQDINEYIARIDTGYSAKECKDILRKMYPNVDFTVQKLAFILIVKR